MCKKLKGCGRKIDKCMRNLIEFIEDNSNTIEVLACCCGHGRYDMSIVVLSSEEDIFDLMSGISIPRQGRFYVKDKQGYYYIPEVVPKRNLK